MGGKNEVVDVFQETCGGMVDEKIQYFGPDSEQQGDCSTHYRINLGGVNNPPGVPASVPLHLIGAYKSVFRPEQSDIPELTSPHIQHFGDGHTRVIGCPNLFEDGTCKATSFFKAPGIGATGQDVLLRCNETRQRCGWLVDPEK